MNTKQATRKINPPTRLSGSPARILEAMKHRAEKINRIQPQRCRFVCILCDMKSASGKKKVVKILSFNANSCKSMNFYEFR
jgi:hypothetical protein